MDPFPQRLLDHYILLAYVAQKKSWRKGLSLFWASLEQAVENRDKTRAGVSLAGLSRIVGEIGDIDLERPLQWAKKALLWIQEDKPLEKAFVQLQLSWLYLQKADPAQAKYRAQQAKNLLKGQEGDLAHFLRKEALEVLLISCEQQQEKLAYSHYLKEMEHLLGEWLPPDLEGFLPPQLLEKTSEHSDIPLDTLEDLLCQWGQALSELPQAESLAPEDTTETTEPPPPPAVEPQEPEVNVEEREEEDSPSPSATPPSPTSSQEEQGQQTEEELEQALQQVLHQESSESSAPPAEEAKTECLEVGIEEKKRQNLEDTLEKVERKRLSLAMHILERPIDALTEDEEAPTKIREQIRQARECLLSGQFKNARAIGEAILEEYPDNVSGKTILKLAQDLRALLERHIRHAFLLEEQGELSKALAEWEKIGEITPHHPKVAEHRQRIQEQLHTLLEVKLENVEQLLEQGKVRLALAKAQELLHEVPGNERCEAIVHQIKENLREADRLVQLAEKALSEGGLNRARELAEKALSLDPRKEKAKKILAYIQGGQDPEQEEKKQTIAQNLLSFAEELMEMRLPEEAFWLLHVAHSLDPARSDILEAQKELARLFPNVVGEKEDPLTPSKEPAEELSGGEDEEERLTRLLTKRKNSFSSSDKTPPAPPPSPLPHPNTPQVESIETQRKRKKLRLFFEEYLEESDVPET